MNAHNENKIIKKKSQHASGKPVCIAHASKIHKPEWDTYHMEPNISVSDDNTEITRTTGSAWGGIMFKKNLTHNLKTTIHFTVKHNDPSRSYAACLYIGVISNKYQNGVLHRYCNRMPRGKHVWSIQGNCRAYFNNTTHVETDDSPMIFKTGDKIEMQVSVGGPGTCTSVIRFFFNGKLKYQKNAIEDELRPIICFGGYDQHIKVDCISTNPIREPMENKYGVDYRNIRILKASEYDEIYRLKYIIRELKTIATYYGLKVGGKKKVIQDRIHNHLKREHNRTILLRSCKRFFSKKYFKLRREMDHGIGDCVNESDFLSLNDLTKIPKYQRIFYKEAKDIVYCFDLYSAYKSFIKPPSGIDKMTKNPYNRTPLNDKFIQNTNRLILFSKILGIPIKIKTKSTNVYMNPRKRMELFALKIFQEINSYGYTFNIEWYLHLDIVKLIKFTRELKDIWEYRSQITPEVRNQIYTPSGDPFSNLHISSAPRPLLYYQNVILRLIENFVFKGADRDHQQLGIIYVLGAFTLVSTNAAIAMPWLYQSMLPNGNNDSP